MHASGYTWLVSTIGAAVVAATARLEFEVSWILTSGIAVAVLFLLPISIGICFGIEDRRRLTRLVAEQRRRKP